MNGKSGENAYLDPVTGEDIDIPAGKTLAGIDPEAARFYEALGDTKVSGELHGAIGDMYTQYLDIPESIVSRSEFKPLETAYRNYEANATVANAAAFLEEAGKVYGRAVSGGYSIESPYSRVNAAMEADFAARQNTVTDIGTTAADTRVIGGSAVDIGATAKGYVYSTRSVGDNVNDVLSAKETGKTISYIDYEEIMNSSAHNEYSDNVMLGKYDGGGATSYIEKAKNSGSTYFDLGDRWNEIRSQYGFSNDEMFELFNEAFLDDCINNHKTFTFSHDPLGDLGALGRELWYLKKNGYVYNSITMIAIPSWIRKVK